MRDLLASDGYLASRQGFHLMSLQAVAGIQFDVEKATALLERIGKLMQEIQDNVEPQLPSRPLKKSEQKDWTLPAKPFKKDGSPSSSLFNFVDKHSDQVELYIDDDGRTKIKFNGEPYRIVAGFQLPATMPMTLGNQDDLKDWLISLGWEPTLWNTKKDEKGKPERDKSGNVIRTSPKIQENQKICPNLEKMEMPIIKMIVTWLSLRNRSSVIQGWLNHPRLQIDGRLPAGSSGFAATHRQRHTVVVNVPKADPTVVMGKEMRELFRAREGHVLVGFDASGLEARVEGHYTWRYDGGEYARELLEGDIHTKNAFIFYDEELGKLGISIDSVDKEDPKFKPLRSRSKNGKYALSYGCSPGKLATTLGVPAARGEMLYESFWTGNRSLGELKNRLENFWSTTGEKSWILGIDGRRIPTRSKHSLINTLFQSCGAIIMDYSALLLNRWLGRVRWGVDKIPHYVYNDFKIYRVGYFHDEFIYECPIEVAEHVASLGVRSIVSAGEHLKLRVPLSGEAKIGNTWADIH